MRQKVGRVLGNAISGTDGDWLAIHIENVLKLGDQITIAWDDQEYITEVGKMVFASGAERKFIQLNELIGSAQIIDCAYKNDEVLIHIEEREEELLPRDIPEGARVFLTEEGSINGLFSVSTGKRMKKHAEKFVDKMSKTLPRTMVEAACAASKRDMVQDKILLLNIWRDWGKPNADSELKEAEQIFITKCIDEFTPNEISEFSALYDEVVDDDDGSDEMLEKVTGGPPSGPPPMPEMPSPPPMPGVPETPQQRMKRKQMEMAAVKRLHEAQIKMEEESERNILQAIQRCREFYNLSPGLERFAYDQEEYQRTKPLWQKINIVLPRLLELIGEGKIGLDEATRLTEIFDDIPEAIMEILDGADEDAVAMKYDRLQL